MHGSVVVYCVLGRESGASGPWAVSSVDSLRDAAEQVIEVPGGSALSATVFLGAKPLALFRCSAIEKDPPLLELAPVLCSRLHLELAGRFFATLNVLISPWATNTISSGVNHSAVSKWHVATTSTANRVHGEGTKIRNAWQPVRSFSLCRSAGLVNCGRQVGYAVDPHLL